MTSRNEPTRVPHVVIVGGGFGGLAAARALRRAPARVTLIDRTNHHLFQPLLYQVATSVLTPGQIGSPLREILRRQRSATVIMSEVVGVDKDARCVFVNSVDRARAPMAVVGQGYAVLESRRLRIRGFPAWLAWAAVHLEFLGQSSLRLGVFLRWAWTYWTGQRGSQLIVAHHPTEPLPLR